MKSLSLKRNMLWNSLGSLFYLGCQWLTTVLVVRLSSGFNAAGALSLAMSIANVFQPLAQYSIRSYQVSDVERETTAGEYVAFRFVTLTGAFVICTIYAALTGGFSIIWIIILYLIYRGGEFFIDVLHGVDQQHLRMDYCGKSMIMRGALSLTAFCIGLSLSNSLEVAILLMILATFPVIAYDWRRASSLDSLRPTLTLRKCLSLLKMCLPAVIGTACCTAVITVARQTLGIIEGQSVLGLYASVCTPVVVVQSCVRYIYAPLLGVFAGYLNRRDSRGYLKLFYKVLFAFVGIGLGGVLVFKLIGPLFLSVVFGSEVASASYLLDIAIASVVLCAFVSFLGDQLIALRDSWGVAFGNAASLLCSVLFSRTAVDALGMNGTSVIVVISYVISSIIMFVVLIREVRRL